MSDIRRGSHGPLIVQADTPEIMNCDVFLPFWVKWDKKVLMVGSGPLDSHLIMEVTDPQMSDSLVATVSSWISAPAEFHFLDTEGA